MKKLILFCLSFYLVSCATSSDSPTVEDAAGSNGSESTASAPETKSGTESAKAQKPDDKPAPPSVAVSMYAALNDGIKSQNDDGIQKAASEILMQNPKDIRGLNALAVLNYKKGRYEAAQYLLNKAIAVNGNSSELFGNLGLVYLAKSDRKEAVKQFRKALQVNPQDAIAGANLGSIYIQEKDYNKASLALEVPVKKGMKDPKILTNYAITLAATGNTKEAADMYEKILKDNASNKEAMLNFAILQIEVLQKNKEGLDLLNRLKFVGAPLEARETIKSLENKAKAGLQ
ncbi:MAG: tetratricopeptide repeat protein [Bdellovibrio sp.]|nr:tetratricopeptide repeat protein [Bdellovibrio sp.]